MSIGLGVSRSRLRRVRIVGPVPTVREVCLVGMTGPARKEAWTPGQKVLWLGRDYQVVATSTKAPGAASLNYVHLVPTTEPD